MELFRYSGNYRVQSRATTTESSIAGYFTPESAALLSSSTVNAVLCAHPDWQGKRAVNLRAAVIDKRSGQFETNNDILYKKDFFTAAPGSASMPCDIVDVRKASRLWRERAHHVRAFMEPASVASLLPLVGDLDVTVPNEYFLHEAGHFLGYDVQSKYVDGYFQVSGRSAAPLIYLEELRADLHGFGFATKLLSDEGAAAILVYNLLLRFGVHQQGIVEKDQAPYGLIPYLLFCCLRELGFVQVVTSGDRSFLSFPFRSVAQILDVMTGCDRHIGKEVTARESLTADPLDVALNAAAYVRRRVDNVAARSEFASVFDRPPSTP